MSFFKPVKPIKLDRPKSFTAKPFVRHSKGYGSARIVRDTYGPDWWAIRAEVFKRDQRKCQERGPVGGFCGKPGVDVHHVVPLQRGGTTTLGNLITLCAGCHQLRHPRHKIRG